MKEETLKKIIKRNLKEKPSDLLTAKIMESVNIEANEIKLKSLLKEDLTYKPSSNFTNLVLENITEEKVLVIENYSPVISKKAWYFIAATFITVFVLAFNNNSSIEISQLDYVSKALDFTSVKLNLFASYFATNRFLMLLIVSVSSLVMIDALMQSNKFDFSKL